MTRLQFACEIFGADRVLSNQIPNATIDAYMNDWKNSDLSFNVWKQLLKSRG